MTMGIEMNDARMMAPVSAAKKKVQVRHIDSLKAPSPYNYLIYEW